jgi:hypothetical protein
MCLKKLSTRFTEELSATDHRLIKKDLALANWKARPIPMTPSLDNSFPTPVWHKDCFRDVAAH